MDTLSVPLVSVGIPTYNRASYLGKAIDSVLMQDYPNIEIVVSDNASTDDTQFLCQEYCQKSNKIRYIQQPINQGQTINLLECLKQAKGEFFMWLGDDDWLESDQHISQCVQELIEHLDYWLVAGQARYLHSDQWRDGEHCNLLQQSGKIRVLSYCLKVHSNGVFYGMMRREQILKLQLHNVIAGDWLFIMQLAFLGKIKTLDHFYLSRLRGDSSRGLKHTASVLNVSNFQLQYPYLSVPINVFRDIAFKSPVYSQEFSNIARIILGLQASMIIFVKIVVVHKTYLFLMPMRQKIVNFLTNHIPQEKFKFLKLSYFNFKNRFVSYVSNFWD